jgi:ribosomal protein S18 acetylase RimI-like enzyme
VGGVADLLRRRGLFGSAGLLWSQTLGRLVDLTLVLEWEITAAEAHFVAVPGHRYAETPVSDDSPEAREAAALLRVRLDERRRQDLFVVAVEAGQVVGSTWNDPVQNGRAAQRGVVIAPPHRRQGLAASLLRFQASALAAKGAKIVDYRTPLGNRASRRLFRELGARRARAFVVLSLFGRHVWTWLLPGWLDHGCRPSPSR